MATLAYNDSVIAQFLGSPGWYGLPAYDAYYTRFDIPRGVSVILQGCGRASRLCYMGTGYAITADWTADVEGPSAVNGPKFRDFDLVCPANAAESGIYAKQAHHGEVYNVHVTGFRRGRGLSLTRTYEWSLRDGYAWGNDIGIGGDGDNSSTLYNFRCSYNRIGAENVQNILGGTFEGNVEAAIHCGEESVDYSIIQPWFEGNGVDVHADAACVVGLCDVRYSSFEGKPTGQPVLLENGAQLKQDGTKRLFAMPGGRPQALLFGHSSITDNAPVPPYTPFEAAVCSLAAGCAATVK